MLSSGDRNEAEEAEAMRQCSDQLRDSIFALLAERDAKFGAAEQGHSQWRTTVAKGLDPAKSYNQDAGRAIAAPAHFPYNHRNLEQVRKDELAAIRRAAQMETQERQDRRMAVFGKEIDRGPWPAWKAEPTYVYREPCSVCGARADIGCKHQRRK